MRSRSQRRRCTRRLIILSVLTAAAVLTGFAVRESSAADDPKTALEIENAIDTGAEWEIIS